MPTSAAVAVGNLGNTIGATTDLTVSGFGTPDAALIFINPNRSGVEISSAHQFGIGFWDGTNQHALGVASSNGETTATISQRSQNDGAGISIPRQISATLQIEATVSNITDGIRLTVSVDNTSVDRYVFAILFKGLTNAYVGNLTFDGTTGDHNITAPGFKPDLVFFGGTGSQTSDGASSAGLLYFGVAHNNSSDVVTQAGICISDVNGAATSIAKTYLDDSQIAPSYYNGSLLTFNAKDFDSSGFTLNTAGGTTTGRHFYLALELADPDDAYLSVKDSATATGNDSETGAGFEPNMLMLIASMCTAVDTATADAYLSIGASDGTLSRSLSGAVVDNAATTSCNSTMTSGIFFTESADGTDDGAATLSSFDADGWTLNYSDAPSSARKMIALAIGDSTAGAGFSPYWAAGSNVILSNGSP